VSHTVDSTGQSHCKVDWSVTSRLLVSGLLRQSQVTFIPCPFFCPSCCICFLAGQAEYTRLLQRLYAEHDVAWFTPSVLFQVCAGQCALQCMQKAVLHCVIPESFWCASHTCTIQSCVTRRLPQRGGRSHSFKSQFVPVVPPAALVWGTLWLIASSPLTSSSAAPTPSR